MQLSDWCGRWAAEPDATARRAMLEQAEEQDKPHVALTRQLYRLRFGDKGTVVPDGYFAWWMNAQWSVNNQSGFFVQRKLEKVYRAGLAQMGLSWAAENGPAAEQLLAADLLQMLRQYVASCTEDGSYATVAFGLMPLKKDALAAKIAAEMAGVCARLPKRAGLFAEYAPLRRAAVIVLREAFPRSTVPPELEEA